jgi:hypothetical protein
MNITSCSGSTAKYACTLVHPNCLTRNQVSIGYTCVDGNLSAHQPRGSDHWRAAMQADGFISVSILESDRLLCDHIFP